MNILLPRIFTVILQIFAAVLALHLSRVSKNRRIWIFISVTVFLVAIQRLFSLFSLTYTTANADVYRQYSEYAVFYISILVLFCLGGLYPLFNALNKSKRCIKENESKYQALFTNLPQCIFPEKSAFAYANTTASLPSKIDARKTATGDITHSRHKNKENKSSKNESTRVACFTALAGEIARNFNNLFTTMLGNAYLARKNLPAESDVLANLAEIEYAAKRAGELSHRILEETKHAQPGIRPLNLAIQINDLRNLLDPKTPDKIEIDFDLSKNTPYVKANPAQIKELILDLINNAIEIIGERHGNIRIRTNIKAFSNDYLQQSLVNADKLDEGEYVYFQIITTCDFGPQENTGQNDISHSAKLENRALGMSHVLETVREHNGGIVISSGENSGNNSYTVLLPKCDETPPLVILSDPTQEKIETKGGKTVLVVDDSMVVIKIAQRLLEMGGFRILTASNGLQAVGLYQRYSDKIDCVLLDMTMKGMTAKEIFFELKELNPNVKVVFSCGCDQLCEKPDFATEHLKDLIQKPYNYNNLNTTLRKAILVK